MELMELKVSAKCYCSNNVRVPLLNLHSARGGPLKHTVMSKRQRNSRTLALFDVDGTLTAPRKVRNPNFRNQARCFRIDRQVHRRRDKPCRSACHFSDWRGHLLSQRADANMLKFLKDLGEVRFSRPHIFTLPSAQDSPLCRNFFVTCSSSCCVIEN